MQMFFLLAFLSAAAPVRAQEVPPVCYGSYEDVAHYGSWTLKEGLWSMPFECSSGLETQVQIAVPDVPEIGYAEYTVSAEGIENGNVFFFTDPCLAMNRFCRYVMYGSADGKPPAYSLE